MSEPLLRLGVSACLLGEEVRYDGGHKRNLYLTDVLGGDVEWVPVCPEVEVGMGVPRPSVRLEGDADAPRMVEPQTGEDWTDRMTAWSESAVQAFGKLDGFVLKKGSPSCGPDRIKRTNGESVHWDGTGLFARALADACPWLPLMDDGRLHDPGLRESFLDHAMWMRRWRDAGGANMAAKHLMEFHRDHKITYMSHDPEGARKLGQLAAAGDADSYLMQAAQVMGVPATRGRNANALQHMLGFVSDGLDAADRAELDAAIREYQDGLQPLLVPLTLISHHARRHAPQWLRGQSFLNPYPKEWRLRLGL